MRKIALFLLFLIGLPDITWGQETILPSKQLVQGIWEASFNEDNMSDLLVFKNNSVFHILYNTKSKLTSLSFLTASYFGFTTSPKYGSEIKKLAELENKGTKINFYNASVDYDSKGNIVNKNPGTDCWISYNEDLEPNHTPPILRINCGAGPDGIGYEKLAKIPDRYLLAIHNDPSVWKSYISFFNAKFKVISISKSYIYKNRADITPSTMYLIQNDTVEILEDKGDWLEMRYYGKKIVEGWIKKSEVK